MISRLKGVLSLSADTFNEIEKDPSAIWQALVVVIVSSILAGLSSGFGQVLFGVGLGVTAATTNKFLATAAWAIVAWLLWSVLTQIIGTKVYNGEATISEMMRVVGFAYAPLAIQVFSFIPIVGIMFVFGAAAWSIAAMYVAVKEGLELSPGNAFMTVAIGGVLYLIGMGIILAVF